MKFWKKIAFFLKFWEKVAIFQKFCCQFQNLRLGVCLAKCLKFPEFEAGCAYELYAYKKKVYKEDDHSKIFDVTSTYAEVNILP